ncbi:MAG: nitrilase-related carbon-nitrogen hydrolase [Solirubrobacteraceae bacterium]
MQALLAQIAPPAEPAANAARAAEVVAAHPEADLIVSPELFLSGYNLARARETAVNLDGPELARVRAAAQAAGTSVIVGEWRGAAVANAVACIDERGELAAVCRKLCLFGSGANVFEAGVELVIAELGGRRVGPLICFDIEFPETAQALAAADADLLVTAAANMEPFFGDHVIASRARTLDNRLPHLYVNRTGSERGLEFVGGTCALAADGTVVAEVEGRGEAELRTEVAAPGMDDERIDYLAQVPRERQVRTRTTTRGASR